MMQQPAPTAPSEPPVPSPPGQPVQPPPETPVHSPDIDVPTPIKTLPELKTVFEKAVGQSLGVGNLTINVR